MAALAGARRDCAGGVTEMSVVLDLRGVGVQLGGPSGSPALADITLCIRRGERVALVGSNGSGKSTLLRVLMGLQRPSSGQLWRDTTCRAALVFQQPYLLRGSALSNVALGLWLQGVGWSEARQRAWQALQRVGLQALAQRQARTLSGGQQQRLALARAWALQPQLWLLDEPTASLDPQARQEVEALIATFAAADPQGATLVFSSHHLGQVRRLASRVLYLERGRLLADLPVQTFFDVAALARASAAAHAFVQAEWL